MRDWPSTSVQQISSSTTRFRTPPWATSTIHGPLPWSPWFLSQSKWEVLGRGSGLKCHFLGRNCRYDNGHRWEASLESSGNSKTVKSLLLFWNCFRFYSLSFPSDRPGPETGLYLARDCGRGIRIWHHIRGKSQLYHINISHQSVTCIGLHDLHLLREPRPPPLEVRDTAHVWDEV